MQILMTTVRERYSVDPFDHELRLPFLLFRFKHVCGNHLIKARYTEMPKALLLMHYSAFMHSGDWYH